MNKPACLCGYTKYKSYQYQIDSKAIEVLVCQRCFLGRTWPTPIQGLELEKYYEEEAEDLELRLNNIMLWENFANRVLKIVSKYKQAGNLLDVGCSMGVFVNMAKKSGFEAYGIDFSEKALEYGREHFNLKNFLSRGSLIDQHYLSNQWDIVTYMHCFEHLEDPASEFKEVHKIIKPNGILVIDVPRFMSIWRLLLGGSWYALSPHQHIWQCSSRGVSAFLEQSGFKVIKAYTRFSLHHEVSFSIRGIVKLVIKIIAWMTGTGDNLIIVARKI